VCGEGGGSVVRWCGEANDGDVKDNGVCDEVNEQGDEEDGAPSVVAVVAAVAGATVAFANKQWRPRLRLDVVRDILKKFRH
jgi:hypothetical protein